MNAAGGIELQVACSWEMTQLSQLASLSTGSASASMRGMTGMIAGGCTVIDRHTGTVPKPSQIARVSLAPIDPHTDAALCACPTTSLHTEGPASGSSSPSPAALAAPAPSLMNSGARMRECGSLHLIVGAVLTCIVNRKRSAKIQSTAEHEA